jgi:hypothetical protein
MQCGQLLACQLTRAATIARNTFSKLRDVSKISVKPRPIYLNVAGYEKPSAARTSERMSESFEPLFPKSSTFLCAGQGSRLSRADFSVGSRSGEGLRSRLDFQGALKRPGRTGGNSGHAGRQWGR